MAETSEYVQVYSENDGRDSLQYTGTIAWASPPIRHTDIDCILCGSKLVELSQRIIHKDNRQYIVNMYICFICGDGRVKIYSDEKNDLAYWTREVFI